MNTDKNKIIANNFKFLRKNLRLTQKEFGEKLDISDTMISKYEKGNREINLRTIGQVCNVYNVNKDWLCSGIGAMYNEINDLDVATMMGKVFSDDDDFLKKVFLTFAKLNDSERQVVKKIINELASK